jgi:predicted amino acid dehydrogenase
MGIKRDSVSLRKERLAQIQASLENPELSGQWRDYGQWEASMSINLGIRPQVVKREFRLFSKCYNVSVKTELQNENCKGNLETKIQDGKTVFRYTAPKEGKNRTEPCETGL